MHKRGSGLALFQRELAIVIPQVVVFLSPGVSKAVGPQVG